MENFPFEGPAELSIYTNLYNFPIYIYIYIYIYITYIHIYIYIYIYIIIYIYILYFFLDMFFSTCQVWLLLEGTYWGCVTTSHIQAVARRETRPSQALIARLCCIISSRLGKLHAEKSWNQSSDGEWTCCFLIICGLCSQFWDFPKG